MKLCPRLIPSRPLHRLPTTSSRHLSTPSLPSLSPSPHPAVPAPTPSTASPFTPLTPPRPSRLSTLFSRAPTAHLLHNSDASPSSLSSTSIGAVVFVQEDVVHVEGLSSASAGSLVRFVRRDSLDSTPSRGLVMAVQANRVVVAVLSEGVQPLPVSVGDRVHHSRGEVPSFPVGRSVQGRVLSPLGVPTDGLPPLAQSTPHLPSLSPASPPLMQRASPTHFLSTGFKHLDFFHPLTRGIRIGLLGGRLTGKSVLALESLIWTLQQGRGQVMGVYVCVGKKRNEVMRIRERCIAAGVFDLMTLIDSNEGDSPASQYLAPFSGCTIADWYRDDGQHCVVVYDDLVTHGAICHGIDSVIGFPSLSPSYIHAKLLERTAAMMGGGGSSTAIVILETPRPERAVSVIESLVGLVDHCVYLDSGMAADGYWPAIHCSSIIGRPSARFRSPLTRFITHSMSQTMLQSERTANQYAWAKEFGLEEEDEDVDILSYREKLQVLLSQREPMALHDQMLSLMAATKRNLSAVAFDELEGFEVALQGNVRADTPALYERLREVCDTEGAQKELDTGLRRELEEAVQRFMNTWKAQRGLPLYEEPEHS